MNNLFSKENLIRALLFLGAALIIVWLLPRKQGNAYHYEMGKPWSYSLLTAPSDMPIYLDTIRSQYLRDSITRNFVPVFVRDVTAEKSTVSAYAARINATHGLELSPGERNQLINALRNILENGIVDQNTYQDVRAGKLTEVRFIHDNTAISIPTRNFLSARAAYSSLDSLFSDHKFRKAIELTAMSKFLTPTISLDTAATQKLFEEVLQKAMAPVGVIQQGERIIDKGDIVTPELYTLLKTYDRISKTKSAHQVDRHHYPIFGQLLYVTILLTCLYLFLSLFRWRTFKNIRYMVFIMSLITAFVLFAYGMSESFRNGLYMVPFTVVAIMMVVFFDGRTAFFVYLIQVLLCAIIASSPLEFLFIQIVAGIVAISSLKELNKRSQLVRAALFIFISYCLSYVAMEIMQAGTLDKLNPRMFGYLGINAVLISFAYVLVFVIEKIFGFISSVTLVELSDVNNPILRELSENCPGTFQHSVQVSSLASEAAHRIGANVQLVRTGALYHDIGKINNPAFFTENQHGVNPHDALNPMQSARIVINHVNDGIRRADKAKLPPVIKDFIRQHHGSGKAKYFFNTYSNEHPDETVDAAPFTYPGPNPQSRETSLLMMADAVEAASRSLKEHTPEAIAELVNRIIDSQIADGLHNESPISFRDVKIIKDAFTERLRTMYHARVSYPELKNAESEESK
ncbi:MAG: HDIG domain-containing protein [Lachnospiraceae bacterium]|nr:HDIG domain-containing protein [Lachnospiraceae bacterium]